MLRLGTGTGFAGAKLSEVLPRSERSLASVRMTDFVGGVEPFKGSTDFEFKLSDGRPRLREGSALETICADAICADMI